MRSRADAENEWFHGWHGPMPTPETDVGEAFRAGWNALASEPFVAWCLTQYRSGRKVVALISPEEAHDALRYAGYYCEDAPP